MSKHNHVKKPLSTQTPKQGPAGVMGSAVPKGLSDSERYARMGLTNAAANAKSRETTTQQSVPLANTASRPTVPPGSMSASNQMNLSQPQPATFGTNLKSAADAYFNQDPNNLSAIDKLSAFAIVPGAGPTLKAAQSALKAKAALEHQAVTNALRTAWAKLEQKGAEAIATNGATLPKVAKAAAGIIPENKLLSEFTNTKAASITTQYFQKITSTIKSNAVVIGGLLSIVGTYPFAGFVKEEAIQVTDFSIDRSIKAGDIETAQKGLDMKKEILNPDVWDKVLT